MNRYSSLRERSYAANMEVPNRRLAIYTFGNVSVLDRDLEVFAIKPSGVSYDDLRPDDLVIVDLDSNVVDGKLKPSSDTRTHAVIYRAFTGTGAIVHTHSTYAVGWAQACKPIPILGTTHADHAAVDIPCTPPMEDAKIQGDYEEETGNQIVEHFARNNLNPEEVQMVLVGCHGPFAWGPDEDKAVYNAVVLEELAKMAHISVTIDPDVSPLKESLRRKHYGRKHGSEAYYGQGGTDKK